MYCAKCGTPNDDAARFCQKCGNPLAPGTQQEVKAGGPPPPPPPPQPPQFTIDPRMRGMEMGGKRFAENKTPWLALLLSALIVGVGQFYNGDMKKGAVMLGGALIGGGLTGGLVWLGLAVWSMVDAWQVASRKWPLW